MSSKVKRKVTVESSKDNSDQPRRPSVFDRLGPGTLNLPSQTQDRHGRVDHNEKCRNWLRTGICSYGGSCRYQHDTYPSSSKRTSKLEKNIDEKDLRHKVRKQRDEQKESRTGSLSPKRKSSKRSGSRSRKGEHESKIKSTVVVTRPRSPPLGPAADVGEKKKGDGRWEDDSDDWPIDAAQLDYKEELTLERKRQQLQRELELELQKERMLGAGVTKTVSFSESSSTSSSSDSGSISSSSDSSSSSSEDDSDDSSSSSSSSSSSASRAPPKKKYKKPTKKEPVVPKSSETSVHRKPLDDYDKIKSSRAAKSEGLKVRSPLRQSSSKKRSRDKKNTSPLPISSPKLRGTHDTMGKSGSHVRKGPRTPSPPPPTRKQRQWNQSSSTDSKSVDARRNRGKRHKKKKESAKTERRKSDYVPTPPRLSSPNRTMLHPHTSAGKKTWQREELGPKPHQKNKDNSPMFHSRMSGSFTSSPLDHHSNNNFYSEVDKPSEKHNKSKTRGHKSDEGLSRKGNNRDHKSQRYKQSPPKDSRQSSISPQQDRYEAEQGNKKLYSTVFPPGDKNRRRSASPSRHDKTSKDRKKPSGEVEKRRDNRDSLPPDNRNRNNDLHLYNKKEEPRVKRLMSPDGKKGRDEKGKDRGLKDRSEPDWNDDHKKELRIPESRSSRLELPAPQASSSSRNDRSRERDRERKKVKDRDPLPLRDDLERDRSRLTPPHRVVADIHPHHPLRDEPSVPVPRSHLYEADLPPDERDYPYVYSAHHDPAYIDERVLPTDYDADLLQVPPLYPPETANYSAVYADTRYRRDVALKDPPHMERIVGYSGRDMSPLARHEPVVLPVRDEDYLDLPLDDRPAYDERWGRSLPLRDDWDPYSPLPPTGLPPHVAASLEEDRYGVPRRRRSSPDWHLRRGERDMSLSSPDYPMNPRSRKLQMSSVLLEPRSRSPQHRRLEENPVSGRGAWREQGDRHANRNTDSRSDNPPKNQDDKKGRSTSRRDRRDRDRSKKLDEHPAESSSKAAAPNKEKISMKRSRSSTPLRKDVKRRKEDPVKDDNVSSDKGVQPSKIENSRNPRKTNWDNYKDDIQFLLKGTYRKPRDETKSDSKSSSIKSKSNKNKSVSPKPDEKQGSEKHAGSKSSEKSENTGKILSKQSSKAETDDKRKRNHEEGKSQVDDEFSDWSDGDDDLLNRDIVESESNNGEKSRSRGDDHKREKSSTDARKEDSKERSSKQKRDGSRDSRIRTNELKSESRSRTGSKERSSSDSSRKHDQPILSAKESDSSEPFVVKDEAVDDLDDFMMTESVDYDPISDGELEALIEEPDDTFSKSADMNEDTKVVDALDVNWSALVSDSKPKAVACSARTRYKAAHVLSRIGFSQAFAGPELSRKIIKFCQKQLEEEKAEEEAGNESSQCDTFQMEHPVAAFHVILKEHKKERENAFINVGLNRRALCARQDLHIRKLLCRPSSKLVPSTNSCVQQYGSTESNSELKSLESQPPVVNAAC